MTRPYFHYATTTIDSSLQPNMMKLFQNKRMKKDLSLKMRDFGVETKTSSTAVNRDFIPIVLTSSKLITNSVEVNL